MNSKRFHRIVDIFNHLDIGKEFTKKQLLTLLQGFYPSANIDHLGYFFTVMRIVGCVTITRNGRGNKNGSLYRKDRNIDEDDLKIAHMTYSQKQQEKNSNINVEKITGQKLEICTKIVEAKDIQKVVENVLILTDQNVKLKKELEELKDKLKQLEQQNLWNMLIKKAEEATGISL
jgi:hypothetical protein